MFSGHVLFGTRVLTDGVAGAVLPMTVRNNHVFVELRVQHAGKREDALTLLDTGGGTYVIGRDISDRLGLREKGKAVGDLLLLQKAPEVFAGRIPVPIDTAATPVSKHAHPVFFAMGAQADLPVALLRRHAVTFKYATKRFVIDGPAISGETVPVGIDARSGFPRIDVEIANESFGFLLDTGASFSMLSQEVIDRLRERKPNWKHVRGSYGPANMAGWEIESTGTMLRIQQARIGAFHLPMLDVVSRPVGTYEKWMSKAMTGPIVGSIGGNVLRNFAFRLDYPRQRLEMKLAPLPFPNELCMVPVTLAYRSSDGAYHISAALSPLETLVGSRVTGVDGRPTAGRSLFEVQQMLRGPAGTRRVLSLERGGAQIETTVATSHIF